MIDTHLSLLIFRLGNVIKYSFIRAEKGDIDIGIHPSNMHLLKIWTSRSEIKIVLVTRLCRKDRCIRYV